MMMEMVMEPREILAEEEAVAVKENPLEIRIPVMKLVTEGNLLLVMKTVAEESLQETRVPGRQPVTETPPERSRIRRLGDTLIE